jgi:transposase
MAAIMFMARTSTPWALLPVGEFGCGSVTSCWRRFAEWAHAGVFERLQALLLDELGQAGTLDWSRISVDSCSLRAVRGGPGGRKPGRPGQARVQAALGSRRRRAAAVAAADRGQHQRQHHVRGAAGRPPASANAGRPAALSPGEGPCGQGLRPPALPWLPHPPAIKVRIARCGIESSQRLGRHRWKEERSIAWLAGCRRLRIRYERDAERFFAFAMLACARVCFNRLPGTIEAHARSP